MNLSQHSVSHGQTGVHDQILLMANPVRSTEHSYCSRRFQAIERNWEERIRHKNLFQVHVNVTEPGFCPLLKNSVIEDAVVQSTMFRLRNGEIQE